MNGPERTTAAGVVNRAGAEVGKSPRFGSVEEYLASLDSIKATTIRTVIDFILAEFPEVQAKIAWNVPTLHRGGKYVAGICAYKHHLTFAPWSPHVMDRFRARLGKFVVLKNCFQLPVDWAVDEELIADLVRARLAELDESSAHPKKRVRSSSSL